MLCMRVQRSFPSAQWLSFLFKLWVSELQGIWKPILAALRIQGRHWNSCCIRAFAMQMTALTAGLAAWISALEPSLYCVMEIDQEMKESALLTGCNAQSACLSLNGKSASCRSKSSTRGRRAEQSWWCYGQAHLKDPLSEAKQGSRIMQ